MHAAVAVVILTWNGWEDTQECLDSLAGSPCRIIVADNGSTDGTVDTIRREYPHVELVENGANLGFSEGNNHGIRHALDTGAEYVMLLNNDTVVDKDFLEPLVDNAPELGFVSPMIFYADRPDDLWFGVGAIDWRIGWPHHVFPVPAEPVIPTPIATGCAVLASRHTWEHVGLLDPRFFLYWEDADWTLRVTQAGGQGLVVADSRIWHKVSRAALYAPPSISTFYFARNGLLFIRKHVRSRRWLVAARFIGQFVVRHQLRAARHRDASSLRALPLAWLGVFAFALARFGPAPTVAVAWTRLLRRWH